MKINLKHAFKKAMVIGVSSAILAGSMLPVWAAPIYNTTPDESAIEHPYHDYEFDYSANKSVIDTNKRGILHIHKSENVNDEANDTDTGIGSTEGTTGNDVMNKFGDVTYTIYRVADIVQGHLDGTGNQVSIEYNSLIKDSTEQRNIIEIPSGLSSAQELDDWVSDLRDSDDPSKRMSNLNELPHWSGTTDQNGNVTFDGDGQGLPLGIYIVYESAYPSQITDPQPFVVSIPTTSVDDGNNDTNWPGDSDNLAGDNMNGSVDNVGVYWIYDVQAHPKNATHDLSVEKHIVASEGAATTAENQDGINDPSNDVLTDTEDYEIGDTIRYWVKTEIPSTIGEIEYYYLLDRMSVGQTFTNDVAEGNEMAKLEVWGKDMNGQMVYIPRYEGNIENYRVLSTSEIENSSNTDDFTDFYGNSMTIRDEDQPEAYAHENAFAVLFNTQSLSEDKNYDGTTKRVPLYSEVYVTFNLVLNEKALIGDPGNVNDISLVLSHTTTDNLIAIPDEPGVPDGDIYNVFENPNDMDLDVINPQCIDTRVYTYASNIKKIGEGADNMTGVEFELRNSRGEKINVSQYTEEDLASLAIDDVTARVGDYYVDKDAAESAIITIDPDQEVYIFGLDADTYQLVETKTLNGYQLLKEPVVLTISSDSNVGAQPMNYNPNPDGDYFQIAEGKGYYIEQDGMKLQINVTGHSVGDYISVAGDVYSYDLAGDDGSMSTNVQLVDTKYDYRWTDSETMSYMSNYGMKSVATDPDGIFDTANGMYNDGLFSFTVFNRHGFNIPSTGGIGVPVFVAIGAGIVVVGLALILIVRKKKNADETK